MMTMTVAERLWANIDRSGGLDACWPWTGSLRNGYGYLNVAGKSQYAHRLAVNAPSGTTVRHEECDNPPCCNPRHLKIGTQAENIEDARVKGRMGRPKGAKDRIPRARKTHCKRDHPLSGDNVYEWKGHRICRACAALRARERYQSQ